MVPKKTKARPAKNKPWHGSIDRKIKKLWGGGDSLFRGPIGQLIIIPTHRIKIMNSNKRNL